MMDVQETGTQGTTGDQAPESAATGAASAPEVQAGGNAGKGGGFEKPPKEQRERAKTKGEAAGDMHVVRVYNWPALRAMGIDKEEELAAQGFKAVKRLGKDGSIVDMEKPMKDVEALRKQRYQDAHGFAPGQEEVFGQHGDKATPLKGSKEVTITTGRDVAASAGVSFDE